MKRIHLFELEDYSWFPNFLRNYMTRYIALLHKILGTTKNVQSLISDILLETKQNAIVDFCSGSGGPLKDVYQELKKESKHKALQLTFSDLFPNIEESELINNLGDKNIRYIQSSVDATLPHPDLIGLRTMICSFHHMKPEAAKQILESAVNTRQPILIFEMSDNGTPLLAGLISFPIVALMTLLLTPFVRPLSVNHLIFTYILPVLPLCIAWDGTISNARTYTLDDLDELLSGLKSDRYNWEKGVIKGRGNSIFLIGRPEIL